MIHREEFLSRLVMLLCFAVGTLLLLIGWQSRFMPLSPSIELAESSELALDPLLPQAQSSQLALPLRTLSVQAFLKAFPDYGSRLIIDLSDRQVHLYFEGEKQVSYPIAIGQPGWETPTGTFSVTDMQKNPFWQHPITGEWIPPGSDNPLGTRWIGFWSNGFNQIGFHGTNQADLIGQAVSHGCIRMHNQDIQALYRQIEPGVPVTVQP